MIEKEDLIDMYFIREMSTRDIAALLGCSIAPVKYAMKKYGLKFRSLSDSCKLRCEKKPQTNPGRKGMPKNPNYGKDNHSYKGGYVNKNGYRIVYENGVQWQEHRLVWERNNCKIPKGYQIHHINEDKLDNRIENLRMMTNSAHQILHKRKKPLQKLK